MASRDARAVLAYHEATKHSPWSVRASGHTLDFSNQSIPYKLYRDLEPWPLPRSLPEREIPTLDAIAASPEPAPGTAAERIPDLPVLARILRLSAGLTKRKRFPGGEIHFRAYSNTGALYHVDLYLVAGELPGLPAGVYHFGPHDFALRRLREGDWRGALVEASGGSAELARAPVVVASASTWWRNSWKYRARAWRHAFWDGGTLHANLLAVAATEGLDPRVVLGFADAPVERLLGLDPEREGLVALVPLGRSRDAPPAPPPERPALALATLPLSREEVDEPEIRAAHAASSLADARAAAAWAAGTPAPEERPAPGAVTPLRPVAETALPREPLDRLVVRRGSTRAFDPARPMGFRALSTALDRATRGAPADFLAPPGATLVDLYLVANAVEGLAPGAYHYRRDERALACLHEGDLRAEAGHLALDQALGACAAVCIYSLADLERVTERLGARGYRAAQLEGGILGGRLYLAAYALGLGATGLTFYDDAVTELFSPHAAGKSVLFLTAIGHPDRRALGLAR